ncbi:hypothetical protein PV327_003418 [Microctonus hyperodae]|uniref:Uncharacterized protein n=1 Tax=Microctonus hyperodae TaxID=165561 RepID=A0AA39L162_MICHY|nr:hypothetical protein PV327_003418 [Microctonus hyperodae]
MAIYCNQCLYFAVVIISLNVIVINSASSDPMLMNSTASRFLEYMDKDADPCNNFYKFACGNFLKTAVIPDETRTAKAMELVEEKATEQLIDILKKPSSSNELKPFEFIKKFYTGCLDRRPDKQDLKPLSQLFTRLGGWPVIEGDQWNDKTWTWIDFIYLCRKNGITESLFIDLSLNPSPIGSKKSIINVRSVDLYYSDPDELIESIDDGKEYNADHKYMVDVIKLILGDEEKKFDEEIIENEMAKVVEFIRNLKNISEESESDELIYNPMTIKNMTKVWPSIQWLDYFQKIVPADIKIDENEIINVVHPKYLTEFEKLIEKTPKRVQANFGIWCAFVQISDILPRRIEELNEKRYNTSGLRFSEANIKSYCFKLLEVFFPAGLNALYVREYFDQENKENVGQMLTNIQSQLQNQLEKIDWMDEETKQNFSKKVNAITSTIAFPDELLNDKILENYYSSLKDHCDNFLECYLNSFAFAVERKFDEMEQPVDETSWLKYNFISENLISYSRNNNKITISAAILQDIIYGKERPNYINYAVLGSFIAGKLFNIIVDEENFNNENIEVDELWTEWPRELLKKHTECLVHHYNNYLVDEVNMTLNDVNNLYSNIERHAGIKLAYDTYNNWMIKNDVEDRLPGFDSTFTPKKLFWLSFANANCVRMDPNHLKQYIEINQLIPPEFQINGALSYIPEFAQDFNCPNGSPMTRNDICTVW